MFKLDGEILTPPYYDIGTAFLNQRFILFGSTLYERDKDSNYKEVKKDEIYKTNSLHSLDES